MSLLLRHARGLAIALVALALSAGMAFAARGDAPPAAAADGLARAAEAAGMTVPVRAVDTDVDEPGETDAEQVDEAETPEAEGSDTDSTETDGSEDNHGALVSEAAQMKTPDGFANHGAFVSCVARMNHGHEDPTASSEPIDLSTLTPEDCGQTSVEATDGKTDVKTDAADAGTAHGKGHGKAKGAKGHGHGG